MIKQIKRNKKRYIKKIGRNSDWDITSESKLSLIGALKKIILMPRGISRTLLKIAQGMLCVSFLFRFLLASFPMVTAIYTFFLSAALHSIFATVIAFPLELMLKPSTESIIQKDENLLKKDKPRIVSGGLISCIILAVSIYGSLMVNEMLYGNKFVSDGYFEVSKNATKEIEIVEDYVINKSSPGGRVYTDQYASLKQDNEIGDIQIYFRGGKLPHITEVEKYNKYKIHYNTKTRMCTKLEETDFNIGRKLYNEGKYEESIKYFNDEINTQSNRVYPHIMLSAALLQLEKYEVGIKSANKAIDIDKTNSDANFIKASCLIGMGKDDEAIRFLDKIIEAYSNYDEFELLNSSADLSYVYFLKGNCLYRLGEYDKALICYERSKSTFDKKNSPFKSEDLENEINRIFKMNSN